ncbi:MAG: helix-turn-helix transcriptional regulator [Lachnospiraceae bacterium]|nr:helix-turn-helix transcriptional regulator [Lachnospiraceae bacterium]
MLKESEFNSIFANNLRRFLSDNNMSQVELANRLGVGTTSIYNWCAGIKTPRMDKVDKMCEIFRCNRSDLITETPAATSSSSPTLTEEEMAIALGYRKADEGRKESVAILLGVKREGTAGSTVSKGNVG